MKRKCVIICSTSQKSECMEVVKFFESVMDMNVICPFTEVANSLYYIMENYLNFIDNADLIVAIPKKFALSCSDEYIYSVFNLLFGESCTYELAYAAHIGKPIVFWNTAVKLKEDCDENTGGH